MEGETTEANKEMLDLYPGDILIEKYNNRETARYIVINRTLPGFNAQYYDVEYGAIILYFDEGTYGFGYSPGECLTITLGDLLRREQEQSPWGYEVLTIS
tara:strand:- start:848 stop:1147 length:300 start_codon:yes stop_codon:yes gene_type:complete